jgi:hypothetical protein
MKKFLAVLVLVGMLTGCGGGGGGGGSSNPVGTASEAPVIVSVPVTPTPTPTPTPTSTPGVVPVATPTPSGPIPGASPIVAAPVKLLKVPELRQANPAIGIEDFRAHGCGPSAAAMAACYYTGEADPIPLARKFWVDFNCEKFKGSIYTWVVYGLQNNGFPAASRVAGVENFDWVKSQIDKGNPFIMLNSAHAVTIIGYTADGVIYNDPSAEPTQQTRTWTQFDLFWTGDGKSQGAVLLK